MYQNKIKKHLKTVKIMINWLLMKPVDPVQHCFNVSIINILVINPGLENSTRLLVFASVSGCRANEKFDIFSEI